MLGGALGRSKDWGRFPDRSLAACQAAILPAQLVASPNEAPRAGVVVRVPAEGMVSQSPVQSLLCGHVPVGGLRGPRLTGCSRERSLGHAAVAEPPVTVAPLLEVHVTQASCIASGATTQAVALSLQAAAPIETRVGAADLAGHWLALGLRTFALALGHTCRLKPMPYFILLKELEELGLEALLFLTVLPSEVIWTDAVWAIWHVHTGPSFLAGVAFVAVVFHFHGLQAVCPSLVLLEVGGCSTPGSGATLASLDALVIQLPVVLEGEVTGLPRDGENHCVLTRHDLMLPGVFPRWNQKS